MIRQCRALETALLTSDARSLRLLFVGRAAMAGEGRSESSDWPVFTASCENELDHEQKSRGKGFAGEIKTCHLVKRLGIGQTSKVRIQKKGIGARPGVYGNLGVVYHVH